MFAILLILLECSKMSLGFVPMNTSMMQKAPFNNGCIYSNWINQREIAVPRKFQGMRHASQKKDDQDEWEDGNESATSVSLDSDRSIVNTELRELQIMNQSSERKINQEEERDLFIPIFTLVSISGFLGAYAYESFRLYSQGELYLPWNNY